MQGYKDCNITMSIIEHEGKRIVRDCADCNPAHFRSAIRWIRNIEVSAKKLYERHNRKQDRYIAERARKGCPIRYRLKVK